MGVGRRLTNRELNRALEEAARTISDLKSRYAEAMHDNDRLGRIAECLINRLAACENASSPPSANSLDRKKEKGEKVEAHKNGDAPARKRSGA